MIINIWLVLSDQAQNIVIESLRWDEETQGEYAGPLRRRSRRLFEYMQDDTTRSRLFKPWTNPQGTFHLWSIDFDDEKDTLQLVRDEIDFLIATYPNQIQVVGAWHFEDGAQVGTRGGGDPIYPIPNWLWRFMPDSVGAASNADLNDINLLYGQSPRDFS